MSLVVARCSTKYKKCRARIRRQSRVHLNAAQLIHVGDDDNRGALASTICIYTWMGGKWVGFLGIRLCCVFFVPRTLCSPRVFLKHTRIHTVKSAAVKFIISPNSAIYSLISLASSCRGDALAMAIWCSGFLGKRFRRRSAHELTLSHNEPA